MTAERLKPRLRGGREGDVDHGSDERVRPAGETRTLVEIRPKEGLSAGYREPLLFAAPVYLTAIRG